MFQDLRIPAGRRPLTSSEIFWSGVALALFLGLILGELVSGFHPAKLSVLFMAVFWVPLLVLHELGHAAAAWAVGWKVQEIVIGFGREIWRFHLGETVVKIRMAPVEGYVLPAPRSPGGVRWKSAFVYAAGPGVELLLVAGLVALFGSDTVFGNADAISRIALKSLVVAALIGAIFNLIPFRTGDAVSDGMGVLMSPLLTDEHIEGKLISLDLHRARLALNAGDTQSARHLLRQARARFPDNRTLRFFEVKVLAISGDRAAAEDCLEAIRGEGELSSADEACWWHARARLALYAPEDDPDWDAEKAIRNARRLNPDDNALRITEGALMVERGYPTGGGEKLTFAFRSSHDRHDDAWCMTYLAIAARQTGEEEAARRFLDAVIATDGPAFLVARLEKSFGRETLAAARKACRRTLPEA